MSNKDDWEELEKWAKEGNRQTVDKYGMDIKNVNIDKKMEKKPFKALRFTVGVAMAFFRLLFFLLLAGGLLFAFFKKYKSA